MGGRDAARPYRAKAEKGSALPIRVALWQTTSTS